MKTARTIGHLSLQWINHLFEYLVSSVGILSASKLCILLCSIVCQQYIQLALVGHRAATTEIHLYDPQ